MKDIQLKSDVNRLLATNTCTVYETSFSFIYLRRLSGYSLEHSDSTRRYNRFYSNISVLYLRRLQWKKIMKIGPLLLCYSYKNKSSILCRPLCTQTSRIKSKPLSFCHNCIKFFSPMVKLISRDPITPKRASLNYNMVYLLQYIWQDNCEI